MLAYWLMYLIPISMVISSDNKKKSNLAPWVLIGIIFIFFIGYRHDVGGDWSTYVKHFNMMTYFTFSEIIQKSDPGYYALNWIMSYWDYSIYEVNLVCGLFFMIGLIIFARRQPNPWLAVSVAFPYLIVVITMGYSRQGVALGFVLWALAALDNKKFKQFLFLVFLASTFHKSAVIMIGLGMFLHGKGKAFRVLSVLIVGIGLWSAFLLDHQEQLWNAYVVKNMQSQGAMIRVAMNLLPSIIFLYYRKKWQKEFNDYSFWLMIALSSIGSIFIVSIASTAVDRIALYITPIQIVVYSRLPYLLRNQYNPAIITTLIIMYYILVLFVWLNYAANAFAWIPYQSILISE